MNENVYSAHTTRKNGRLQEWGSKVKSAQAANLYLNLSRPLFLISHNMKQKLKVGTKNRDLRVLMLSYAAGNSQLKS